MKIDIDEAQQKAAEKTKTIDLLILAFILVFIFALAIHFLGYI